MSDEVKEEDNKIPSSMSESMRKDGNAANER